METQLVHLVQTFNVQPLRQIFSQNTDVPKSFDGFYLGDRFLLPRLGMIGSFSRFRLGVSHGTSLSVRSAGRWTWSISSNRCTGEPSSQRTQKTSLSDMLAFLGIWLWAPRLCALYRARTPGMPSASSMNDSTSHCESGVSASHWESDTATDARKSK